MLVFTGYSDTMTYLRDWLRGEERIAELCRREGIASSMYYGWPKEFLEAGKRRLAGDTTRARRPPTR